MLVIRAQIDKKVVNLFIGFCCFRVGGCRVRIFAGGSNSGKIAAFVDASLPSFILTADAAVHRETADGGPFLVLEEAQQFVDGVTGQSGEYRLDPFQFAKRYFDVGQDAVYAGQLAMANSGSLP